MKAQRAGISHSELGQRLGVGPSRIRALLTGTSNLTIDTLVRAGRAVGADLELTFVPQGRRPSTSSSSRPAARRPR